MKQQLIPDDVRKALQLQRRSIDLIEQHLDVDFGRAVELLSDARSIVASGVGKSGFIARKFAASLTSLGCPATFVHAVDALHGDIGAVAPGTVIVLFSKSGDTRELVHLLDVVKDESISVICISARISSALAERSHITLLAPIEQEYDRMNILPTASTTAALIVADLLVMSVAHARPNTLDVLSRTHPGGSIGSLLGQRVKDHMHCGQDLPLLGQGTSLEEAIHVLDRHALGIVCVASESGVLLGILTDGDLRRLVERGVDLTSQNVQDVMTMTPETITSDSSLYDALQRMESRDRAIGVLPVVETLSGALCGVIRLHDVVRAQMAG